MATALPTEIPTALPSSVPSSLPTAVQFVASPYGDALRIASVFILFVASFAGVALPLFYYGGDPAKQRSIANSDGFKIVRSFSAGIMIGVGFIHLLFEGNVILARVSFDYPALGSTVATMGTLFVLGCEQLMVTYIGGNKTIDLNVSHVERTEQTEETEVAAVATDLYARTLHDHNQVLAIVAQTGSLSVLVKAYMMEFSIAVHSVVIGVGLGYMSGESNLGLLKVLIVALVFHQFFEGLGLGTTLQEARLELGKWQVMIFILIFSGALSGGIIIGILLKYYNGETETTAELYTTGCLHCVGAGILIYIALVEMVGEDFNDPLVSHRWDLKVKMFIALSLGNFFLAIIGIWA